MYPRVYIYRIDCCSNGVCFCSAHEWCVSLLVLLYVWCTLTLFCIYRVSEKMSKNVFLFYIFEFLARLSIFPCRGQIPFRGLLFTGGCSSFSLIDVTFVRIDAPFEDEPAFVHPNNGHFINLTLVAGPKHEFNFVSYKCTGLVHNSRALRVPNLWRSVSNLWTVSKFYATGPRSVTSQMDFLWSILGGSVIHPNTGTSSYLGQNVKNRFDTFEALRADSKK